MNISKRFDIWPFEKWEVLEEKDCAPLHFEHTSIRAVRVKAGLVHYGKSPETTPIIKWFPKKDFEKEKKKYEGNFT